VTDPARSAVQQRVFWLPIVTPFVAAVAPAPQPFVDSLPLEAFPASDLISDQSVHYLAFGPPGLDMQITAISANPTDPIAIILPIDHHLRARIAVAERLWRCIGKGDCEPPGILTSQRRARLVETLRALDGRMAGASIREIASELYGADRVPAGREWKSHDLRSRTKRLVGNGFALMRGGYRDLLRPPKADR
jgi:hypothetical protein